MHIARDHWIGRTESQLNDYYKLQYRPGCKEITSMSMNKICIVAFIMNMIIKEGITIAKAISIQKEPQFIVKPSLSITCNKNCTEPVSLPLKQKHKVGLGCNNIQDVVGEIAQTFQLFFTRSLMLYLTLYLRSTSCSSMPFLRARGYYNTLERSHFNPQLGYIDQLIIHTKLMETIT